jgi:hypothetical protein
MAADVAGIISNAGAAPEQALLTLTLNRIRAWQEFMSRPRSGRLTAEEELGLVGELFVLLRLVSAGFPPPSVLKAWEGPARGIHDFRTPNAAIEVKATLAATGFPAQISSLEQLDQSDCKRILLTAVRLCLHGDGKTLPTLVLDVRNTIRPAIGALAQFERALLLSGYLDDEADHYTRKFAMVDIRTFEISNKFPCLTRSNTSPEIRSAKYEIDIDLVKEQPSDLIDAINRCRAF